MNSVEEVRKQLPDHMRAVRAFALRLTGNPADADDLFQETLARALANAHQYSAGSQLRSWLFTIARNTWINEHRRRGRERPGLDVKDHPGCCAADQEWRLHGQDVADALDRLTKAQVELITFVALEGG